MEQGAVIVDTRHAGNFAEGHLPGSINIPLDRTFNTWAGWLVPFDMDIYLITDGSGEAALVEAVRDLAMIGLDRVAGHVPGAALESWQAEGASRGTVTMINVDQLYERMGSGELAVVDVRGASEWQEGHLPGVPNIPVGYLLDRRDELPQDRPLVLQCRSGARSAIAASVLQAEGMTNVVNLVGGYAEWVLRGLPVEVPEPDKVVV
jgi:hydroxyacylglutathione hydrolase